MAVEQANLIRTRPAWEAATGERLVSIAIVDTIPLFRDGLSAMIDRTPWVRLAAQSASQQGAVQMVAQLAPDVVLLDSGLDPYANLTKLLARGEEPRARVVVIVRNADQTSRYLAHCMAAGAHAAVSRTAEAPDVLEAVRHAHRAHRYLDPRLTSLVANDATLPAEPSACPDESQTSLTRREYQIMQLIAEGLPNAKIAQVLFLSVETVRTHVKRILRKLDARDRTHAVSIGFRSGLLPLTPLPDAPPPS